MHLARSFAFAATILFTCSTAPVALAQEPSSTGKGIVGTALLGAEVVLLTEAAIDVSPSWLYYVGGAAGAIGGGIGGYFIEDQLNSKGNMALLAAGMLLVIPTTVAVLSATAYEQPAEYTQDQKPQDEPVADPAAASPLTPPASPPTGTTPPAEGQPSPTNGGASAPATTTPVAPAPSATPTPTSRNHAKRLRRQGIVPPALVGIDAQNRIHLGIPAVEVRNTYSRIEVARFGVQQRQELRIPLLRVTF